MHHNSTINSIPQTLYTICNMVQLRTLLTSNKIPRRAYGTLIRLQITYLCCLDSIDLIYLEHNVSLRFLIRTTLSVDKNNDSDCDSDSDSDSDNDNDILYLLHSLPE